MSADIFISHSSKDQMVAETLCAYLEGSERGFGCWYAARDVQGGDNYAAAIPAAIRTARVMLFIYSENSNTNSDEVLRELTLASQYKLTVIPLRLSEVEPVDALRFHLVTRQWIDYFPGKEDEALARLTRRIGAVLAPAQPVPPPAPPFVGKMVIPEPEPVVEEVIADPIPKPAKKRAPKPNKVPPQIPPQTPTPPPPANDTATAEVESLLTRGDAYYNIGKFDLALAEYSRAIQLMPTLARANNARGLAYQGLAIYDLAVIDFDEAIRLNPAYAEAYTNRGNVFVRTSQDDRALVDYDEAIRLKPELAAPYNNRGFILSTRQMFDRAIADFDTAIRLKPDFLLALQNRANAYRKTHKLDQARRDRIAAAAIAASNRSEAAGGLKSWQIAAGLGAALVLVLIIVAGASPSPAPTDLSTSQASSDMVMDTSAGPGASTAQDVTNCEGTPISITACDSVINDPNQTAENQASAENYLGLYYYDAKQYTDAMDRFSKAIALVKAPVYYANLANCYYSIGGTDNNTLAIDNYNTAIGLGDKDADTFYSRGNAYYVAARYDDAISDYTQAINTSPQAIYLYERASAYDRRNTQGDPGRAIEDLDAAINADASYGAAYYLRGTISNDMSPGSGDTDIAQSKTLGYSPS